VFFYFFFIFSSSKLIIQLIGFNGFWWHSYNKIVSPNCERLWINRLVPVLIAKANLVENDRLISVKCRNEIWLQSKKNYMWCRMIRMIFHGRINGWVHFFRNQFSMPLNSDGLDRSNGGRNFLPLTNSSNPSPAYETKGDISQIRCSSRFEHIFWLKIEII
jgi:hypothetical protein